ncbi:unnamed protein product [Agarophyton chilense]
METLGKALGKGTEKVRTWYNNRRATDRRQGIDVTRNAADELSASAAFPTSCPVIEETVLLPSHVLAHPTPPSSRPNPTHAKPTNASPIHANDSCIAAPVPITPDARKLPPQSSPYVNVTPSSISWAPSIANTPSNHFSHSPYPSNRYRISPLRIRHVCLALGSQFLYGELPHNLQLDRGLEVKFLFGKKRVVYEWYYGQDYSMAQSTGGPYCKMEMNFSSISTMQLFTSTAMSMLVLSFSTIPALFVQTQQSMDKYKLRSQQRQYRKVSQIEFPVRADEQLHAILLRPDEAIRTAKILFEDSPRLLSIFQVHNDKPFPIQLPSVLQNLQHLPSSPPDSTMPMQSTPIALPSSLTQTATAATVLAPAPASSLPPPQPLTPAVQAEMIRPPSSTIRRPLSIHELSSRHDETIIEARQHTSGLNQASHPIQARTTTIPASKPDSVPSVKSSAAEAHARDTTANWHSPSTPYTRVSKPWPSDRLHASHSTTPLTERINRIDTPSNGNRVRRELNFNGYGQGDTPLSTMHKRKLSSLSGKENEERAHVRRKLIHNNHNVGVRLLAAGIPPPPLPPPLPAFPNEQAFASYAQNGGTHTDKAVVHSSMRGQPERVVSKLPR